MERQDIHESQRPTNQRRRFCWVVVALAILGGLIVGVLVLTDTVGKETSNVTMNSNDTVPISTGPSASPMYSPGDPDSGTIAPQTLSFPTIDPLDSFPTLDPTTKPASLSPDTVPPSAKPSFAFFAPSSSPTTISPTDIMSPDTESPTSSEDVIPTVILPPDAPLLRCNNITSCNLRVNQILFATAHNAHNTLADGIELFYNHERNLTEALHAGYRGINVDIGICDDELRLVHSFCFLGYSSISNSFREIAAFLQENKREILLMPTQLDFETGGEFSLLELEDAMPTEFKDFLYQHPGDVPWPTLQELIDADRRILFFHYNGERCSSSTNCPFGFMNWFDYAAESEFSFANAEALDDKANACRITRGGTSSGFYGVNVFTSIPNEAVCRALNGAEFLRTHISACGEITQRQVNLVLVDCWDSGDVLGVVHEFNEALT